MPKQSVIPDKWEKTVLLQQNRKINKFIPETKKLDYEALQNMLKKHKMVYIKPSIGGGGVGIMKINKLKKKNSKQYKLQKILNKKYFVTYDGLFNSIQSVTSKKEYIIQKGIYLCKYQDRLMDLRIMVQENLKKEWEVTGLAARISGANKIVTNVNSGGVTVDFDTMLNHFFTNADKTRFLEMLHTISLETAKQLQKSYPNLKEIGVDIGLDRKMYPWILEVNTKPDPRVFFRDKRTIEKVVRYGRSYGRKYNLKPKYEHEKKFARKLGKM
ncbi:YheC/YheD family protein [Chengkuizengella axinellae]|uniref:YheC/YheD family protein n=1 Tax=Chengkuizengella axinellae TaxID=3064388 RepID=A0ABT9J1I0_9BACL|nr:YheC/YheD family protein [Chengkuizengella sp. 2205SS18-9]MDP5275453.1 YheC/YheD family protein [Chengkuizengella sp. 2205SS18-9]